MEKKEVGSLGGRGSLGGTDLYSGPECNKLNGDFELQALNHAAAFLHPL